jgi:hypothetical protein
MSAIMSNSMDLNEVAGLGRRGNTCCLLPVVLFISFCKSLFDGGFISKVANKYLTLEMPKVPYSLSFKDDSL